MSIFFLILLKKLFWRIVNIRNKIMISVLLAGMKIVSNSKLYMNGFTALEICHFWPSSYQPEQKKSMFISSCNSLVILSGHLLCLVFIPKYNLHESFVVVICGTYMSGLWWWYVIHAWVVCGSDMWDRHYQRCQAYFGEFSITRIVFTNLNNYVCKNKIYYW